MRKSKKFHLSVIYGLVFVREFVSQEDNLCMRWGYWVRFVVIFGGCQLLLVAYFGITLSQFELVSQSYEIYKNSN